MTGEHGIGVEKLQFMERLFTEFGGQVPLPVITAMVHECREQLCTSPEAAMPELIERLARQRLTPTAPAVPVVGI